MRIRVSVHGVRSTPEFTTLARWLSASRRDLEQNDLSFTTGAPPGPGEMGGAYEVVEFLVGAFPNYAGLALQIAEWRRAYRTESSLVIEGAPEPPAEEAAAYALPAGRRAELESAGVRVVLEGHDVADVERVLNALVTATKEGQEKRPGGSGRREP